MVHKRALIGNDAPTLCWYCLKLLMRVKGYRGPFYYHKVVGPDGIERRVHGGCVRKAVEDGSAKLLKEP
jgi:hypothetical protein